MAQSSQRSQPKSVICCIFGDIFFKAYRTQMFNSSAFCHQVALKAGQSICRQDDKRLISIKHFFLAVLVLQTCNWEIFLKRVGRVLKVFKHEQVCCVFCCNFLTMSGVHSRSQQFFFNFFCCNHNLLGFCFLLNLQMSKSFLTKFF